MASPRLRHAGWTIAAVGAAAVVGALALHGRRPETGLVRFEPKGVMVAVPLERVGAVDVVTADRRWRFARDAAGAWRLDPGASAGPGGDAARVAQGLRFLAVSAPQRVMQPGEFEVPMSELGLDPPRYVVAVHAAGAAPFTVEFGAPNPQGLAQYVRVGGRRDVVLLPRFVGAEWEMAVGLR